MIEQTSQVRLSAEELAQVAGIGGEGLRGRGRLQGQIALSPEGQLRLITANEGTRSEVSFLLDLPPALGRTLVGQTVWIAGLIEKGTPWVGTIKKARWVRRSKAPLLGAHVVLRGRIENRSPMGIGGEAPPSGSYLLLDQPLRLGAQEHGEVFVDRELAEGAQVELHGRLEERRFGGVERPESTYLALSGVSDLGAGEPRFDGVHFLGAHGEALRALVLERREMFDAPNLILVLDEAARRAFLGTLGGMRLPGSNPFHGFGAAAPIADPTEADRAALRFPEEGPPVSAQSGEALDEVGRARSPGGGATDQLLRVWYYDDDADAVYQVASGGIAGLRHHLEAVIHLPQS